ncbi:recombination protein NinG [Chryseobacterium proteolyticum]|uniref:recombination protein NinG n=1 Tax=Chryseobacterium proteolyticum TaxID=118127 RepID=UPI003983CF4D
MKEIKPKECVVCGEEFIPSRTTQKVCGWSCAIPLGRTNMEKQNRKAWNKEKKIIKDKQKTHKDWLKDLEKVVNEFIRLRDKGKPCISCGSVNYTMSAGHYFPAGSYGNVRFDEDNIHGQCWFNCNSSKHGNLAEYTLRLPERIGKERFEQLQVRAKQTTLKLSIPEIKEKIEYYRGKIREMKAKPVEK